MIFHTDHAFLFPKDSGLKYGSLSNEELLKLSPRLTEEEKKLPHAKYYREEGPYLPEELRPFLTCGPMDPAKAFYPWEYGKYMNTSGYCEVENGYCVLPNGITFAAAMIRQEGRTDEMVRYYNEHFAPEGNLFYKTWCPGSHYLHYTDGCFEDFGFGRLNLKFMSERTPEEAGIDVAKVRENDPACIMIYMSSAMGYNLDSDHPDVPEWNSISFYHRITEYGREVRARLWYGYGRHNGETILTPPPAEKALEVARSTMLHMMLEYSNDQYLETRFWNDRPQS